MANKAIRGITVEIGGDTTKLGKALDKTEKETRFLETELKEIEKLLKFDPTNTELLAQKQNVLAKMIDETSDKLNIMAEAEKQVVEQFEKGEIGENQLRAFQREIVKTNSSLGSMKKDLSGTKTALKNVADGSDTAEKHTKEYKDAVKKASDELVDFKDKAKDAYDALATGAGVLGGAAIATGGYALNLSTNFDQAFNSLVAKTGASADEMDSLNEAMTNVYANNFGESIEDVANSMATVKQNTNLSGAELENATERALMLRDTFEFDVNESTRAAKMLMDQYGLSAEDAYNLIAQGAQNGLDKNGDLLDTVNEYAVHFKGLGYSSEEMFNMLVNGAESGTFSVDKLGDAVKEFGIRAKDGTAGEALKDYRKALGFTNKDVKRLSSAMAAGGEESKNAMQEVTAAVFDIEDPIKRNSVGVQLFGTMWEDLGEEGVKALMNVEGQISTTNDALDTINEQKYDDIGSALQGLGRSIETDVVQPLGEELKPVVEDAIEYVQENGPQIKSILSGLVSAVGKFVGFIVNNGSTILSLVSGIGAAFAVWKVASMINGVVGAIKAFKTANEAATIAQALFNAVMNANPIVLLISLIVGIVAAIATFVATNDKARAKFKEIWESIKNACSSVVDAIVNFFTVTVPQAFDTFVTWVKTNWQSILLFLINPFAGLFKYFYDNNTQFKNFVDTAVAYIKELPGKIWVWLSDVIGKISSWGMSIWTSASLWTSNLVSSVVNWFGKLPGRIWTWLVNVVGKITTWGAQMWGKAVSVGSQFISSVVKFFSELPGKIWEWLSNVVKRVGTWGSTMALRARTAASNFVSRAVTAISQLPSKIWEWLSNVVSKVVSWGSTMATKGRQAAVRLLTAVVNKVKEIPDKIVDVGGNLVEGIWNGVKDSTQWIKDKISGWVGDVTGWLKGLFGIESPSKLMRDEVGRYIAEGIGVGITENADKPMDALKELSEDMAAQEFGMNDATINRKLATTFDVNNPAQIDRHTALLSKLDGIYDRLNRLQIVLDSGTLIGETIDRIDAALADRQLLSERGV